METTVNTPTNSAETQGQPQPELGKRVSEAAQQVGESFRENVKVIAQARQSTLSALDGQKQQLAARIRDAEKTMSKAAERMKDDDIAKILSMRAEKFAHGAGALADYLERKDLQSMAMDAREAIRQHPAIAFGAIFAVGLALGRFLKATEPNPSASTSGEDTEEEFANFDQEDLQSYE